MRRASSGCWRAPINGEGYLPGPQLGPGVNPHGPSVDRFCFVSILSSVSRRLHFRRGTRSCWRFFRRSVFPFRVFIFLEKISDDRLRPPQSGVVGRWARGSDPSGNRTWHTSKPAPGPSVAQTSTAASDRSGFSILHFHFPEFSDEAKRAHGPLFGTGPQTLHMCSVWEHETCFAFEGVSAGYPAGRSQWSLSFGPRSASGAGLPAGPGVCCWGQSRPRNYKHRLPKMTPSRHWP
jgi:hypothetical protein